MTVSRWLHVTESGEDRNVKRTPSLRVAIEAGPDGQHVALAGSIDENSDLAGMFAQLVGPAVINLRHIERVNSMGVHRWVPLVTQFSARHPLAIDEISYALVQNANVVANLFGTAVVRSCVAPYFCSACNDNCSVVVTMEEVAACAGGPPVKHCGRCRAAMEFDELDGYFSFFKTRSKR